MSRICENCLRGPQRANIRSHSMRATPRKVHINLQNRAIAGRRMRLCAKCLKTMTRRALEIVRA